MAKDSSGSAYRSLDSRLGITCNCCRSCQQVNEEETIEHFLWECKALYNKTIATIDESLPDDISEVEHIKLIKLVVPMKYIRGT